MQLQVTQGMSSNYINAWASKVSEPARNADIVQHDMQWEEVEKNRSMAHQHPQVSIQSPLTHARKAVVVGLPLHDDS